MVKFISYDGEYPNLCSGTLTVELEGMVIVEFKHALCSGGVVWFDEDWGEHVEEGSWSVNLPPEYEKYKEEITELVNENVPWGCCGGCV